jgi:hypothetical protein
MTFSLIDKDEVHYIGRCCFMMFVITGLFQLFIKLQIFMKFKQQYLVCAQAVGTLTDQR